MLRVLGKVLVVDAARAVVVDDAAAAARKVVRRVCRRGMVDDIFMVYGLLDGIWLLMG